MKNYTIQIICLFLAFWCPGLGLWAQNNGVSGWNQFRGPDRSGTCALESEPDNWPENEPVLLWKKSLGTGFSEITVEDKRIYTLFSERTDTNRGTEYLGAFDSETGLSIWKTVLDSMFFDQFGDGPRSTPLIDSNLIFSLSSHGNLIAIEKMNGHIKWQINLPAEFGSILPRWGFSTSPVLLGNTLILEAGGSENRGYVGIDKETGKLIWKQKQVTSYYSSPVVAKINGIQQVIFINGNVLYSFDEQGDTLWSFKTSMFSPTPMPVLIGENKIFVSSLQSNGFCIVEVNDNNPREILQSGNMKNDFSSSVYHEGYIYGFNVAAVQCVSVETGDKSWTKRGLGKGSLILAGDRLLILSDKGKLVVAKANPESYEELGQIQALEGKSWTAPSFYKGRVYLRNLQEMACYQLY